MQAVKDVSFHLDRGETLAILGESGSGKSVSAEAIMNLIDSPPGYITAGEIRFQGESLIGMERERRRQINGRKMAMIFQDPLAHLNPVYTVGWQIAEILTAHGVAGADARARALELAERVGIPDAKARMNHYPHQFSGGQRQRLMIAMALGLKPDILIADEPTTALDVTVQAQILRLLEELQEETGMGLLLITHDLGVVAEVADRVVVMNSGEIVESGSVRDVFKNPTHPYTRKLIDAVPGRGGFLASRMLPPSRHRSRFCASRASARNTGAFWRFRMRASRSCRARRWPSSANPDRANRRSPRRCCGSKSRPPALPSTRGAICSRSVASELFAMRREIQMVFQDPTPVPEPAHDRRPDYRGGMGNPSGAAAEGEVERPRRGATRASLAFPPILRGAILISSQVGSASASPSRVRWRSTRN